MSGSGDGPVRFAVVGRGYRAQAFLRLASLAPDRFRVTGVAARDDAGAAEVAQRWGVPAVVGVRALLALERPDVVVTAVPAGTSAQVVVDLVAAGVAVLSETPPAAGPDALAALWRAVGPSGLVQVAEQYALQPMNAARLAVVRAGVLGEVTSAHVSMTQTYHALSLLRAVLGLGGEEAQVRAVETTAPLANPFSRAGWSGSDAAEPLTTTLATVVAAGRVGLYDFTQTQTRNPLRRSRFLVRGSRGELHDEEVVHLRDAVTVVASPLVRRQVGQHGDFEAPDLDHVSFEGAPVYRNPFPGARLSDEEIAMAACLEGAGLWARGLGEPPYPLAAAAQDQVLGHAVERAAATGEVVRVPRQPWAGALEAR